MILSLMKVHLPATVLATRDQGSVLVAWEDGSQTYEPLQTMAADNPAVCAVYAERANLLDTEGWKLFRQLA